MAVMGYRYPGLPFVTICVKRPMAGMGCKCQHILMQSAVKSACTLLLPYSCCRSPDISATCVRN